MFVRSILACLILGSGLVAQEGGLELFTGETLFSKGMRTAYTQIFKSRERLFDGSSRVGDPLHSKMTESRGVLSFDYGLRRDLTLSILVPQVHRELRSGGMTFDSHGLGDVAVFAKYQVHRTDWHRGAFNLATSFGLELPTGSTDERDSGMRLSPKLQPGSGAVNPFLAVAMTTSQDRWRADANVLYKFNTEGAQDFEAGDFLNVNVSVGYRFLFKRFPGPSAKFTLGLQWRHEYRAELNGSLVAASGSDQILVRPSLSWHPDPAWDLGLTADLPIYQDMNGRQLGRSYGVTFAFGYRF